MLPARHRWGYYRHVTKSLKLVWKSMGAQPSKEVVVNDLKIGYQYINASNDYQDDVPIVRIIGSYQRVKMDK